MTQQTFKYRPFQSTGIDNVARKIGQGIRRIVFQAPTGAGKTVLFCGLIERYRIKFPTHRILIAVHRVELLGQTVKALKRINVDAAMVIANHKSPVRNVNGFYIPHSSAPVLVGMVETLNNRLKKYDQYLGEIHLVIVDEVHRGEFNKLYAHFPNDPITIGFTATPLSANRTIPLKNFFNDIVSPVSIIELIRQGHLARNKTVIEEFGAERRKKLAVNKAKGDFDETMMGTRFSEGKHVQNCITAYEQYALGQKTLIFNCNIEHSLVVTAAFQDAGYNARHMDGTTPADERKEILDWFAKNDDAILNNVAVLTTGFDEPTIRTIIMNRATMSLPLWLQCCGRGSRSIPGEKDTFTIIDMGGNAEVHFDWRYAHDWVAIFENPPKAGDGSGVAPTKECPKCHNYIPAATKVCTELLPEDFTEQCGHVFVAEQEYDTEEVQFKVIADGIDVPAEIETTKQKEHNPYSALHQIKVKLVKNFRIYYKHRKCPQPVRENVNDRFQVLVEEWCRQHGKPYNKWHKTTTREWIMEELNRKFGPVNESYQQSTIDETKPEGFFQP